MSRSEAGATTRISRPDIDSCALCDGEKTVVRQVLKAMRNIVCPRCKGTGKEPRRRGRARKKTTNAQALPATYWIEW